MTLQYPKVSIITPSFRSARYISSTIESVLFQNYPSIEHIIIDGASDDGTVDILKKYPHLIWISEPDRGQSEAINKGMKLAKGEIVAWLNADDVFKPDAVSVASEYLMNFPEIVAVYGDMEMITEHGETILLRKSKCFNLETLFFENFINQPTVFVRKYILDELHGLDERLHYSMDRELWLRIGSQYVMQYLPGWIGAGFRLHSISKTCTSEPKFHAEWATVMENSLTNALFSGVSLVIKNRAVEQAKVRFLVSTIRSEAKKRDVKAVLISIHQLVTKHWRYILKYPLRKLL